ncbi:hypothetical protein [Sphingopyxis fribergensis]|uniref:hypothetical protein n=1 Tax=Sphingopyxis fribergensis TaxID=1515612 RepID=UPI0011DC95B8|nr:hypothetical protein [Sphingopyxis fribergensis]
MNEQVSHDCLLFGLSREEAHGAAKSLMQIKLRASPELRDIASADIDTVMDRLEAMMVAVSFLAADWLANACSTRCVQRCLRR